jgi:hypothetical protein
VHRATTRNSRQQQIEERLEAEEAAAIAAAVRASLADQAEAAAEDDCVPAYTATVGGGEVLLEEMLDYAVDVVNISRYELEVC